MEIASFAGVGKSSRYEKIISIVAVSTTGEWWTEGNSERERQSFISHTKEMTKFWEWAGLPDLSYLDSPFAINNNLGSPMGAKKSSTEVRWRKGGSDWLRFLLGKLSRFMLKFLVISLPPNTVFGENPRLRAVRDSFTKSFSTHSPNAQQIHTRVSRTPEKTPLRKKVRAEDFKRWMRNGSFILRMS